MRKIVFITLSVLLLQACGKEKKLERTLTKKTGMWNVSSAEWATLEEDPSGTVVESGNSVDIGWIDFNKDGNGYYELTVNGELYEGSFEWSNDADSVYMTQINQLWDNNILYQHIFSFSGVADDDNQVQIYGTNLVQGDSSQYVLEGTFTLTR